MADRLGNRRKTGRRPERGWGFGYGFVLALATTVGVSGCICEDYGCEGNEPDWFFVAYGKTFAVASSANRPNVPLQSKAYHKPGVDYTERELETIDAIWETGVVLVEDELIKLRWQQDGYTWTLVMDHPRPREP